MERFITEQNLWGHSEAEQSIDFVKLSISQSYLVRCEEGIIENYETWCQIYKQRVSGICFNSSSYEESHGIFNITKSNLKKLCHDWSPKSHRIILLELHWLWKKSHFHRVGCRGLSVLCCGVLLGFYCRGQFQEGGYKTKAIWSFIADFVRMGLSFLNFYHYMELS